MANNLNNNNITNSQLITGIILHDLHLICSFIISYPLYFSYVIYFVPYVIKLVSFVSPLYIVTVFLSVLITATTMITDLNALKLGIVEIVVQVMKWNLDECDCDCCEFEEFEIYKIVFDCEFLIMNFDQNVLEYSEFDELGFEKVLECSVYGDRRSVVADFDSDLKKLGVEKIPEISAHSCRRSDVASCDADVDKIELVPDCRKFDVASSDSDVDKYTLVEDCRKNDVATCKSDEDKLSSVYGGRKNDVAIRNSELNKLGIEKLIEELDKFEDFTPVKIVSDGSEARDSNDHEKLRENSVISNSPSIVSSYGSVREDNEWRNTLACKLFEERHNSLGGEEGMDSLWETHEYNNSKNQNKNNTKSISFNSSDIDIDTDTDIDEMAMSNGHLCCLQALKFSTGKMNLGMGKPNIVKITKAFKGFRWLNYVKKKHGKKS